MGKRPKITKRASKSGISLLSAEERLDFMTLRTGTNTLSLPLITKLSLTSCIIRATSGRIMKSL
jgi:hypothetical protein